jgi:hypothetical protein
MSGYYFNYLSKIKYNWVKLFRKIKKIVPFNNNNNSRLIKK